MGRGSNSCSRGEMDITAVFGTVVGGSNPSESIESKQTALLAWGIRKTFRCDSRKVPAAVVEDPSGSIVDKRSFLGISLGILCIKGQVLYNCHHVRIFADNKNSYY